MSMPTVARVIELAGTDVADYALQQIGHVAFNMTESVSRGIRESGGRIQQAIAAYEVADISVGELLNLMEQELTNLPAEIDVASAAEQGYLRGEIVRIAALVITTIASL